MRARFFIALGLAAAPFIASCIDPVHSDDVDALGGEVNGIRPGPTHRAGQPCLVCHGSDGPGSPEMSVGGTIYAVRGGNQAQSDVTVTLTDAHGAQRTLTSNSVGNFYVFKSEWDPVFPLKVAIDGDGAHQEMKTTIGRDGGCATCHRGVGDARHMPAVFLRSQ